MWSLPITYAVAMLFKISHWLNEPFGKPGGSNDAFESLCTDVAYSVLQDAKSEDSNTLQSHMSFLEQYTSSSSTDTLLQNTSGWLRQPLDDASSSKDRSSSSITSGLSISTLSSSSVKELIMSKFISNLRYGYFRDTFLTTFFVFSWTFIIGALYLFLPGSLFHGVNRWWAMYLPIQNANLGYLSNVVSVMSSFWLQDAYRRYRRTLELMTSEIIPLLQAFAYQFSYGSRHHALHKGDIERYLSHIAALPVTLKSYSSHSKLLDQVDALLSMKDAHELKMAHDPTSHVLSVIASYMDYADSKFSNHDPNWGHHSFCGMNHLMQVSRTQLEASVAELQALKNYNIVHPLRSHLVSVTCIFLLILPICSIVNNQLMSFLFVIPSIYLLFNTIRVGFQLDHPFGTGRDDIPMDQLRKQIKSVVHDAYQVNIVNRSCTEIPTESSYTREQFTPKPHCNGSNINKTNSGLHDALSIWEVITVKVLNKIPKVNVYIFGALFLWNIIAVFASYGLSSLKKDQSSCRAWCSIIDIDWRLSRNVGVIFFTILSFRAYEVLGRYDDGRRILGSVCMNVSNMASDIAHAFPSGTFHSGDKERIIAHLIQIPLSLRDKLLYDHELSSSTTVNRHDELKTVLSCEDDHKLNVCLDPLEASINAIEAYYIRTYDSDLSDDERTKYFMAHGVASNTIAGECKYLLMPRMYRLRTNIAKLMTMKKFPFVRAYRFHQQLFIGFWLACLPLSVSADMGFFSILTTTLISYGVLAFETCISDLVDPFGKSRRKNLGLNHDVPVKEMCETAAAEIIENLESTKWDVDGRVYSSGQCGQPRVGTIISHDGVVKTKHDLPTLEFEDKVSWKRPSEYSNDEFENGEEFDKVGNEFDIIREENETLKPKKIPINHKTLSYLLYSIPWHLVQLVTIWTAVVCFLSYIFRDQSKDGTVRWWASVHMISSKQAALLSFITFTLLAFYVNEAYVRYAKAAKVWHGELQVLLHSITGQFKIFWENGAIHQRDKKRLIGHIAAMPYALKADLRHSKCIQEMKGLLSPEDLANMVFGKRMSLQVWSVIRSYYTKVAFRSDTLPSDSVQQGRMNLMIRQNIPEIESAIQTALHYRDSDMAPQFTVLLNVWLVLWFVFLPFMMIDFSGWLTILWVPCIAISTLGMRELAGHITHPYGNSLNDLDLDALAHDHAADVISTYRTARIPSETPYIQNSSKRTSNDSLMNSSSSEGNSSTETIDPKGQDPAMSIDGKIVMKTLVTPSTKRVSPSVARRRLGRKQLKVALYAISKYQLLGIIVWNLIVMGMTYLTSRLLPLGIGNEPCRPWFCSPVAAEDKIMEYIGYGLFLILSFRMADSHARFSNAVRIWTDEVVGTSYLLLNRFYMTFQPGMFHHGDMARVGAHVQAFSMNVLTNLRGTIDRRGCLSQISHLTKADIDRMLRTEKPSDATIDVIRGYLLEAERFTEDKPTYSGNDLSRLFLNLRLLSLTQGKCTAIKHVQIPIGYLLHLRLFILLWILILPLALVQQTGWTTILWSVIISYTVIAIEHWASELSDPFGCDFSDIALEEYAVQIKTSVRWHNDRAAKIMGMANINTGRPAFPLQETESGPNEELRVVSIV